MTAMCHRCGKEREAGVYGKHCVCHRDPGAAAAVPINWGYNLETPIKERVMEEEEGLKSMNAMQQLYTYLFSRTHMKESHCCH